MRKDVVSGGLGLEKQRNEKQQRPIVECQVYIQYSLIINVFIDVACIFFLLR